MERTAATRLLILVLALSAVLALPGGLLAAVSASSPGCPHCRSAAPGLAAACSCCQQQGIPGQCGGACGQAGGFTCRCGSSGTACITSSPSSSPTWQVAHYVPDMVNVSAKLLTPKIFHPPELNSPA